MKDKPISVGDMAMVIKLKSCCRKGQLGFIFTVSKISIGVARCTHCGAQHESLFAYSGEIENGRARCVRIDRLKRIPPLDELETTKERETITA